MVEIAVVIDSSGEDAAGKASSNLHDASLTKGTGKNARVEVAQIFAIQDELLTGGWELVEDNM